MKTASACVKHGSPLSRFLCAALMLLPMSVGAESLTPAMQEKVNKYTQKVIEWSQHPKVVDMLQKANLKGGVPGTSNLRWVETNENDPAIAALFNSDVSKLINGWATQDPGISKLYLRDKEGNLVAADGKPVFYNNAHLPPFKNPRNGKPWAASAAKPDPTTQINGVHVGVPVMDRGQVIGVLHTSVVAD